MFNSDDYSDEAMAEFAELFGQSFIINISFGFLNLLGLLE